MPPKPASSTLSYPASTAYKQWVWKEIRRKGWVLQTVVDEMKRRGRAELAAIPSNKGRTMLDTLSTSTLINLLGPEGGTPEPSMCSFMVVLNRVLDKPPPPIFDPSDEMALLVERFKRAYARATPKERAMFETMLGPNDDPGGMDGGSPGPSKRSPRLRSV